MINRRQWLRVGALLAGAPVATAAPTPATNLAPLRLLQPCCNRWTPQLTSRSRCAAMPPACNWPASSGPTRRTRSTAMW